MLHIMNCDSARGMWLKLHEVYENQSETTKHMLQQKWFSLGRDAADDIATHIAKIKDIACRLTTFEEPVPDSMIITKILLTLPPSLKHFATAWESTGQDQRTLTNLISRLSMEEIRAAADEDIDNKAFFANTKQQKFSKGKSGKKPGKCYNCGRPGHWKMSAAPRKRCQNKMSLVQMAKAEEVPS